MTDFNTYTQVLATLKLAKENGIEIEIVGDKARITNMGTQTWHQSFYYTYQIHSYIQGFLDCKELINQPKGEKK